VLNFQRSRSITAATLAAIIADHTATAQVENCFLPGVLRYIGDILALLQMEEVYLALFEDETKRVKIKESLLRDAQFNVDTECSEFLIAHGVPQETVALLSPAGELSEPDRLLIRTITLAA